MLSLGHWVEELAGSVVVSLLGNYFVATLVSGREKLRGLNRLNK